jgi:O-antigen ligase
MYQLVLLSLVLVGGLALPTIAPFTAVYVALAAVILCFLLFARALPRLIMHPSYLAVAAACLALAVTIPFNWRDADELMVIVWMLPVVLPIGVVAALAREPRYGAPAVIGAFCLVGAIGAVSIGAYDALALETSRAGGENNPIHFGGLATILGFAALVGIFQNDSRWRFIFLLGPLIGSAAVLLSGSRGPILSVLILFALTMPLLAYWFRHAWLFWAVPLLAAGALVAAVMILVPGQNHYIVDAIASAQAATRYLFENNFTTISQGPENIDGSTWQRLIYLRGALDAFADSPIFGHGAGQLISAAAAYFPPGYDHLGAHLHADIANFAVVAGVFGLLAYALMLIAPFLAVFATRDRELRRAVLLLAIVLGTGYFALGLTNGVFGILAQTLLYGILLAAIVNLSLGADRGKGHDRDQTA